MRNRLIELLKKAPLCNKDFELQYSDSTIEKIADYLLANGVIVPPCKVGQTVYVVRSRTSNGKNLYMREERVDHYRAFDTRVFMLFESGRMSVPDYLWGARVFLTREEAEAKLKEGGKE